MTNWQIGTRFKNNSVEPQYQYIYEVIDVTGDDLIITNPLGPGALKVLKTYLEQLLDNDTLSFTSEPPWVLPSDVMSPKKKARVIN